MRYPSRAVLALALVLVGCSRPTLRGRCVDPLGRPIAKATIETTADDGSRQAAQTGADGRFTIALPEKTARVRYAIRADGCVLIAGQRDAKEFGEPEEFELEPGAHLSGRAVDMEGLPLAGETVRIDNDLVQMELQTDAEGRFATGNPLPLGAWVVHIRHVHRGVQLTRDPASIDLVCAAPTHTITGRVIDAAGQPPGAGAQVFGMAVGLRPLPVQVDADGRFTISLPLGMTPVPPLFVSATIGDTESPRHATVAWGTRDLDLVVAREQVTRFVVLDAETGAPVANAQLHVRAVDAGELEGGTTDAEGYAEGELPAGSIRVRVTSRQGHMSAQPHEVSAAERAAPVRIAVPRGRGRTVQVTRSDGGRVADLPIEVCSPSGVGDELTVHSDAITDSSGLAVVYGLADQSYTVRVAHPVYATARTGVNFTEEATLRLEVAGGGRLEGQLGSANALVELRELRGNSLTVRVAGTTERSAAVDPDGRFTLQNLPLGEHELLLMFPGSAGIGLGRVAITGGITRHSVSLDALRPVELAAAITVRGQRYTGAVYLLGEVGLNGSRSRLFMVSTAVTGELRARVLPGRWQALVLVAEDRLDAAVGWVAAAPLVVPLRTPAAFAIEPVAVELTCTTTDGKPAAPHLSLVADTENGMINDRLVARREVRPGTYVVLLEPGRHELSVLPKRLFAADAYLAALRTGFAGVRRESLTVAIDVASGSPTARVALAVPVDAGY